MDPGGEDDRASSDFVVGVAVPSESVGKTAAAAFGPDFLMPISSHLPPSRGTVSDGGTAGGGGGGGQEGGEGLVGGQDFLMPISSHLLPPSRMGALQGRRGGGTQDC